MKTTSESGSHLIALAVGIVVVGVIGFAGYTVYMRQAATTSTDATGTTATVKVPAKITNTASLNQAATALDQASAQVNSNLDDTSLNADLNDLL